MVDCFRRPIHLAFLSSKMLISPDKLNNLCITEKKKLLLIVVILIGWSAKVPVTKLSPIKRRANPRVWGRSSAVEDTSLVPSADDWRHFLLYSFIHRLLHTTKHLLYVCQLACSTVSYRSYLAPPVAPATSYFYSSISSESTASQDISYI